MIPVLIKLEISTPQKMKAYSLGIELGLSRYLAIAMIRIARITLDTADTIEAPI